MVLLIVGESCADSVAAVREGQPLGVFMRNYSILLSFGWQHVLEEPVGILLLWEYRDCERSQ